jgi:hypothetical protein
MSVKHDGMAVPIYSHYSKLCLSIFRIFLSGHIDLATREQKFLKPSRIWEMGRDDLTPKFASNQKAVGTAEKMCLEDVIEKTEVIIPFFHPIPY